MIEWDVDELAEDDRALWDAMGAAVPAFSPNRGWFVRKSPLAPPPEKVSVPLVPLIAPSFHCFHNFHRFHCFAHIVYR